LDLTRNYQLTLKELKDSLVKELGENLDSLVLYGSIARQDFHTESDIDILLILENKKMEEAAFEIAYKIDLKNGTFTAFFTATPGEIGKYRERGSPFLDNVSAEGKILYDNGTWEKLRGSLVGAS
jgi:predicted nucleotidyltransferase